MQAKDVMTAEVETAAPETDIRDIARKLIERGISAVPVVDGEGRVLGIVSEGDLMRRHESETERKPPWWLRLLATSEQQAADYTKTHGQKAGDVMSAPAVTVSEDTPLEEIARLLERHRIKRVPVVRDGKLVGIVSRANLLHGLVAIRTAGGAVSASDEEIQAAIEKELVKTGIRERFVSVIVADGVVQLWGAVESEAEREAARVAAETVPGTQRVESHIGIFPQIVRATMGAE
jgi:CBS domain-containing protein